MQFEQNDLLRLETAPTIHNTILQPAFAPANVTPSS